MEETRTQHFLNASSFKEVLHLLSEIEVGNINEGDEIIIGVPSVGVTLSFIYTDVSKEET